MVVPVGHEPWAFGYGSINATIATGIVGPNVLPSVHWTGFVVCGAPTGTKTCGVCGDWLPMSGRLSVRNIRVRGWDSIQEPGRGKTWFRPSGGGVAHRCQCGRTMGHILRPRPRHSIQERAVARHTSGHTRKPITPVTQDFHFGLSSRVGSRSFSIQGLLCSWRARFARSRPDRGRTRGGVPDGGGVGVQTGGVSGWLRSAK